MMRPSQILRRDSVVYGLLFIVWAVVIYGLNSNYSYFATPPPSVSFDAAPAAPSQKSPAAAMTALADTITRQEKLLFSEKKPVARGRTLGTVGAMFFQLYGFTRNPAYLDSASRFCSDAIRQDPKASPAYYVLGRIMTEKKDFASAKAQYEKAIAADPRGPISYQALGVLLWFNLKQAGAAKPYFEKALALDSAFPTVNYVLGILALQDNDQSSALKHFESETRIFNALAASHAASPVDPSDVRTAACFSYLRLSFLYSTAFVDAQKAQDRFNAYLNLETDSQRKQASVAEIQKYWKTNQPANGSR